MSDEALIRKENLKRLCAARGLKPADLAKIEGLAGRPSYWSDLLERGKSFGEKKARQIEDALGLARGTLDLPPGGRASIDENTDVKLALPVDRIMASGTAEERRALADMLTLISARTLHGKQLEATIKQLRRLKGDESDPD